MHGRDSGYRKERTRLLGRIVHELKTDERVVAAWLAGSLGRGADDNLSDLDLWVVVDDAEIDEIIDSPSTFVQTIVPTIVENVAPQNAPEGGAYLLTWMAGEHGPQQVDWYWQTAGRATRPVGTKLLFQRQGIPWTALPASLPPDTLEQEIDLAVRESLLMAFIAGKHIVRGDLWVISRHLVHVARCIGTVAWLIEHGRRPAHDDVLDRRLPVAIPASRAEQISWIRVEVDHLAGLLASERPGMLVEHAEALGRLNLWIEFIGNDASDSVNQSLG